MEPESINPPDLLLGPYMVSGVSKALAENEDTWILQPGAERGPGLDGKIIALVIFIESE